jgi:chromosome partitioning protein
MIITLCGQKGGTGKTTLSFLLAETLSRAGKRVAVRDDDPQKSLTEVIEETRADGKTKVELWDKSRAGDFDFVIVDTQPRLDSRVLQESIREADRLILPLKPSMVDIRATLPAVEMVKANLGKDARAFVLWNMVKQGTRISRELESLEAMIGLPVLKGQVPERIGFTYATLQGYEAISGEDRELLQRIVLEFII